MASNLVEKKKRDLVRVFVKGGIISPGDFHKIINTASDLGAEYIHFGSRQDILFPVNESNKIALDETFKSINTEYEITEFSHQNIVCSYVALDVMPNKKWLVPHVYHYILDSFEYRPKLRINIVDPSQSLVPLFTGNINFIASSVENYWYVYLRYGQKQESPKALPILVYGYDIAKVAKIIEDLKLISEQMDVHAITEHILNEVKINFQAPKEELKFPVTNFPYYEGINRKSDGKSWMGLYWRNNKFSIPFLRKLCRRCIDTNVGKISLTPWKSFVVKGIQESDRVGWEKFMGSHGMNLRHSALELNWHLPVLDEEALNLKNYLVRALDQQDISTSGLTFTIKTSADIILFTSVVIEKNLDPDASPDTFNIMYSKNFNPNLSEYFYYAKNITKEVIPALLIELSLKYYQQLEVEPKAEDQKSEQNGANTKLLYQCENCMTIYDESYGDSTANIEPGISFHDLPDTYACPLCGNKKENFKALGV
ncbi:MAG: rubredoxin domain-containing protein [Cyclobacteriaceae bacterium]